MKQEYKIKGVEKILEAVSKEELARYYGVDMNANFEQVITQSLQKDGIPNNSEIGVCVHFSQEEYEKGVKEGKRMDPQDIAKEFYEKDERKRAMYGINYVGFIGVLYFVVDEPIKESDLGRMDTTIIFLWRM